MIADTNITAHINQEKKDYGKKDKEILLHSLIKSRHFS